MLHLLTLTKYYLKTYIDLDLKNLAESISLLKKPLTYFSEIIFNLQKRKLILFNMAWHRFWETFFCEYDNKILFITENSPSPISTYKVKLRRLRDFERFSFFECKFDNYEGFQFWKMKLSVFRPCNINVLMVSFVWCFTPTFLYLFPNMNKILSRNQRLIFVHLKYFGCF